MSPRPSLTAAAPITFLVYGVGTLLAALPAAAFDAAARRVGAELPGGPADLTAPGGGFLVDALRAVPLEAGPTVLAGAAAVLLGLLLAPWLQMAWLLALAAPSPPTAALTRALGLYGRCLVVRLLVAGVVALLVVVALGIALAVRALLEGAPDDRLADLFTCAPLGVAALALLPLACLWDLAHAQLAHGAEGPFHALRGALRSLRPRVFSRFLAWRVLTTTLLVAANGAALLAPVGSGLAVHALLAATQALFFARAFVRAAWLRDALGATAR